MTNARSISVLICMALALSFTILWGCAQTFIVAKDGKGYFFGSKGEGIYKMLCESGDLKKILDDTHLQQDVKDNLYKYNCTQQSREKVNEIYTSLTIEERRELRLSFQLHGYDINVLPC